ncbi:MAG: hypothetical protein EA422_15695 [Gemmatimonadales bacterium]|nr:MAG: hypothetical protein EA422_15695 [Gemmatimonadales bacterium]
MNSMMATFQVNCPSCGSEFDIDRYRVPTLGIAAICSECFRTFRIEVPAASDADPTDPADWDDAPDLELESESTPADSTAELVMDESPPPSPAPVVDEGFQDLSSLTAEALAETEEERAPQGAVASGLSRFGRRDPHDRARRLARVLVSDIIAYYPEKHAEAVREGRVRETFEEEVEKSRREYIEQVGREMADSTDYFRVALNEVLARGTDVY